MFFKGRFHKKYETVQWNGNPEMGIAGKFWEIDELIYPTKEEEWGDTEIYKCQENGDTKTIYAIKVCKVAKDSPLEEKYPQRENQLINTIKNLKHKNLLEQSTAFLVERQGTPYCPKYYYSVSLYCECDLKQKNDSIDTKTALEQVIQIADGLQQLHANNIFHRDLKPNNIFLLNNVPKIGDYDMATIIPDRMHQKHKSKDICTVIQRPPEYLEKKEEVDPEKGDVWGLGIILFILLYKCDPFSDIRNEEQVLKFIKSFSFKNYPNIKHSPEIEELISKMLSQNLSDRWKLKEAQEALLKQQNLLKKTESEKPKQKEAEPEKSSQGEIETFNYLSDQLKIIKFFKKTQKNLEQDVNPTNKMGIASFYKWFLFKLSELQNKIDERKYSWKFAFCTNIINLIAEVSSIAVSENLHTEITGHVFSEENQSLAIKDIQELIKLFSGQEWKDLKQQLQICEKVFSKETIGLKKIALHEKKESISNLINEENDESD